MVYLNREDAGAQLVRSLSKFKGKDTVVMGLPRGGVVLAAEVAKKLEAPLGAVLVKRIGHPTYPEYAIGAVAEGAAPVFNQRDLTTLDIEWVKGAIEAATNLIRRRRRIYYDEDLAQPDIARKTVILVDDGIATGLTMEAAARAMLKKKAKAVIVAVPVAAQDSIASLKETTDEVIVLDNPENFLGSVGAHYTGFEQVSNNDVKKILQKGGAHVFKTTA